MKAHSTQPKDDCRPAPEFGKFRDSSPCTLKALPHTAVGSVSFRVHLTNIVGTGAVQLAGSLLPAMERVPGYALTTIYLPDRGVMAGYRSKSGEAVLKVYRRWLPNAISRLFECLLVGHQFAGSSTMLVLGDIPIRGAGPQVVFLQNAYIVTDIRAERRADMWKYRVMRLIFKANVACADVFVVQTEIMCAALLKRYPKLAGKVRVIHQPVPRWLLESGLCRAAAMRTPGQALRLFYPSAGYPHKNHRLLGRAVDPASWPVAELVITIEPAANPAPLAPWVVCVGQLGPAAMVEEYRRADAVLFLSTAESYGFPLLEAMWLGLPLICPDLPYARTLCGDHAIYFQSDDAPSLRLAVDELKSRLDRGWWPNWSEQLSAIPSDWSQVADEMLGCIREVANNAGQA